MDVTGVDITLSTVYIVYKLARNFLSAMCS